MGENGEALGKENRVENMSSHTELRLSDGGKFQRKKVKSPTSWPWWMSLHKFDFQNKSETKVHKSYHFNQMFLEN